MKIIKILYASSIFQKFSKVFSDSDLDKIAAHSIWVVVGVALSRGITLIILIYTARILGSELYGQYGLVRNSIIAFSAIASFSLGVTATKYVSETINKDNERCSSLIQLVLFFCIISGGGSSILIFNFAEKYSVWMLESTELYSAIKMGSLLLFATSFSSAVVGVLQGLQLFKPLALYQTISAVISAPLYIYSASRYGVNGVLLITSVQLFLLAFLGMARIVKHPSNFFERINLTGIATNSKILIIFSFPALLSGLVLMPAKWYSELSLARLGSFSDLGLFVAIVGLVGVFTSATNTVAGPILAAMSRDKDKHKNSILAEANLFGPWLVGLLVIMPVIIYSDWVMMIFGDSFLGPNSEKTLGVMCIVTLLMLFKQGLARVIVVYSLQWWAFASNLTWSVLLIGVFIYIDDKNSFTLSLSYLLAYTVSMVMFMPIYVCKGIVKKSYFLDPIVIALWFMVSFVAIIKINNSAYNYDFINLVAYLSVVSLVILKIIASVKRGAS